MNPTIAVAVPPDPMLPIPYRIKRARAENYNTFTLELEPVNGERVPSFAPGQFNMLYIFGVGEVAISISGDPARSDKLIHTIREVGTVTSAMHRLKRGDMIGVRGPFGSSWPVDEAKGKDIVLVTGGIGLAPLRPVMYHLLANRDSYGKIGLLYGARTPKDLLYLSELEKWRSRFDLNIESTVDSATREWRGNVGVVTSLLSRAQFEPAKTVAMLCGPEVMMRYTVLELQKRGVGDENIFVSMERNMKCAVGFCGHCQFGPVFICKDGPVFPYSRMAYLLGKREV
jgi:NAD(P)H-flavin reductase